MKRIVGTTVRADSTPKTTAAVPASGLVVSAAAAMRKMTANRADTPKTTASTTNSTVMAVRVACPGRAGEVGMGDTMGYIASVGGLVGVT